MTKTIWEQIKHIYESEPMPFPNATGSERGKRRLMFSLGEANCAE